MSASDIISKHIGDYENQLPVLQKQLQQTQETASKITQTILMIQGALQSLKALQGDVTAETQPAEAPVEVLVNEVPQPEPADIPLKEGDNAG